MSDALTPGVVDVPLSTLNQTPPDHGGPIGRVSALVNAEVTHYVPPAAGGTGGVTPQTVSVQQREGFVSLAPDIFDVSTGTQQFGAAFPPAELVDTLGDQLLSVAQTIPKAWNGTGWSEYLSTRVLTNKLSQEIFHTSNRTIQACDHARIGGVTCFVWTETSEGLTSSWVGFRATDGAWVRTASQLYASASAASIALAKVVADGAHFWVFWDNASANLQIAAYDTRGAQLAAAVKARNWTTSPGFWDCIFSPDAKVVLAQPASYSPGTDVHVEFTSFALAAGPSITQSSHTDATVKCQGPVAWLTGAGISSFSYLATIVPNGEGISGIYAYEVNTSTLTQVHEFHVQDVNDAHTIDSMTGYTRSGSGVEVVVAVSTLSEYFPAAGPPNDPGLRNVRVYNCSRSNVQTLVKQANGVCLQSRAFTVPNTPTSSPEFYAVTYYQSGGGLLPGETVVTLARTSGVDFMLGELDQPLAVVPGDGATGSAQLASYMFPAGPGTVTTTKPIASITHNAGDSVDAATSTWTFLNGDFSNTGWSVDCTFGLLTVTGSSIANNNQSYYILSVTSSHVIVTEAVGSAGHTITSEGLTGVTASVTSRSGVSVVPSAIPAGLVGQFIGGTVTYGNLTFPANNGTYTITRIFSFTAGGPGWQVIHAAFPTRENSLTSTTTVTLTPLFPDAWILSHDTFTTADVGQLLRVSGALNSGNDGDWPITSVLTSAAFTAAQPTLYPEFFGAVLPKIEIRLADPMQALTLSFAAVTFDLRYIGATLTIANASNAANNGSYVIDEVIGGSGHVIKVHSATSDAGQRNESFPDAMVATVVLLATSSPAYQPCWFITPLSITQQIAGRFEYGVAFADWRFDGATMVDPESIGVEFPRNNFPFALSSVPRTNVADALFILPYRAQSFTAGQIVRDAGAVVGIAAVQESTVGLKQFTLSGAGAGQAVSNSGEMLLPGPMAGAFTASGFHEDAVALGFEQPFSVSQSVTGGTLGLTKGSLYQYTVVAEVMDENGDRTFSVPSPPLNVSMTGSNNTVTLSGRTIGPTNRQLVGIAIYRTANQGGAPTVQHYKITDDLDVNGLGFMFSSINGGPVPDTWQYVDTNPDVAILSQEIVYTDKGLIPRFPAPAFSQGLGSLFNRTFLVGYDGAVWMSGEKTEGDAIWFTPLFRFVLPTDDKPVAVGGLDEYLIIYCSRSKWYVPKTDFPAANLQSGSMPTPIELPSETGCTGWAKTIRGGVAYASTAGGVWLTKRDLTEIWLSQAVQDELTVNVPITSMAIDRKQRLFVLTGGTSLFMFDQVAGCWSKWILPGAAALAATWMGRLAYQDKANPGHVAVHTPGVFADTIGGVTTGAPPDITIAGISFSPVRGFKRSWAIQIVGQYKGPHRLNVVVSYPDEDEPSTVYDPFTPDPSQAYVYEVNPNPEEASTFGVRVFADFNGIGTPGDSFTLELVSFEVGLQPGINRLPSAKRIPSGG